jgi:hypothetical protein
VLISTLEVAGGKAKGDEGSAAVSRRSSVLLGFDTASDFAEVAVGTFAAEDSAVAASLALGSVADQTM